MSEEVNGPAKSAVNGTEVRGEPSEHDPCMGEGKNRRSEVFLQYRDILCKRTGLSHKGLYIAGGVLLVLVLLFITVVVLAALWPHIPHSRHYPICTESSCLRASAQVRDALDDKATPCSDLWGWACGGWLRKHPLPKDRCIWNQKQQLVRQEAQRVRDLIATLKLPLASHTVEWKLKHLYESCLDVDTVNAYDARSLTEIITLLGDWYILGEWNERDFDPNKLLQELHVNYGVSPYFKISVEPNPNAAGQNIISISPSGLGLPDKEYYYRDENDRIQIAYKELIRDVVIYLNSPKHQAMKFGTDIFSYEKRIAEITPDLKQLQNHVATANLVSVSELKATIFIPFLDILTAMYRNYNISENTEVIVTSLEYLQHISQIISTTDRRTLNGYLVWTLVRKYIPYMAEKYTSTLNTFNAELFGIEQPLERWEMCSNLVQKFMGLAANSFIDRREPITEHSIEFVSNIYTQVLNVVKSRISKYESKPLLYKHLIQKLNGLQLQIGLPKVVNEDTYLKEYYNTLKIIKHMYFDNVKNGFVFQKKIEERLLMYPKSEDRLAMRSLNNPPKVVYVPSENVIVIPRSLLSTPTFDSDFPRSLIYGRLGVEIAEAVLSAVLPYGSLWTADKKLLSTFHAQVNQTLASVKTATRCLTSYISSLNLTTVSLTTEESGLNTLKQVLAVSIANEALTKSAVGSQHIHQPALEEYEEPAIFFLSYAQTQCSESTSQYQLYDNIKNFDLPQSSYLHLVWSQLPEFSESLGCNFDKKLQCRDIN